MTDTRPNSLPQTEQEKGLLSESVSSLEVSKHGVREIVLTRALMTDQMVDSGIFLPTQIAGQRFCRSLENSSFGFASCCSNCGDIVPCRTRKKKGLHGYPAGEGSIETCQGSTKFWLPRLVAIDHEGKETTSAARRLGIN